MLADVEPIVNTVKRDVSTWKVDDKRQVDQVTANWPIYMCTYSVHINWAAVKEEEEEEEKTGFTKETVQTLWREHKVKKGKGKVQWQYKVK